MSKALENQVTIAEYARVVFAHTPGEDVKPDDVLAPEYWANVANKLKPGCRIEVLAPDLTFYSELIVIDAGRTWAKVAELHRKKLTAPKVEVKAENLDRDPKGYEITFAGTAKKYRVVRKSDKVELKDGFATEQLAEEFLKNHLKALSL